MKYIKKIFVRRTQIIRRDARIMQRGAAIIFMNKQKLHWFERDLFTQVFNIVRLIYLTTTGRYLLFILYYLFLCIFISLVHFFTYF